MSKYNKDEESINTRNKLNRFGKCFLNKNKKYRRQGMEYSSESKNI